MRKINLTHIGVLAVLAFVFTLGGCQVHDQNQLTLTMPACPIKAATVATTTVFTLPPGNPLDAAVSVGGTVQITDQTSSTVILTQIAAGADPTSLSFARTVKQLAHATAQLTFDHGCTKTDPYGSNNCAWTWGDSITAASQGALQEDIQAGKLIVDLKINNTIPFQFSCPVCGGTCTVTIPDQLLTGTSAFPTPADLVWFGALLGLVPPPPAPPGTIHLLGPPACPAGSNWSTAACWDLNRAPITGDDVVIANNAQASTNYDLDSGVMLHSITVSGASGPVTITGGPIGLESGAIVTDSFSNNGTDTLPGISLNGPDMFAVTAAGETLQISGAITGAFAVTKTGGGVLLLSGTNPYSGGTMVSAGTLLVNGSLMASPVTVGSGASMAGTGSVPSIVVQSGGTLSGNLTATAGTTLNAGSTFSVTVLSASSFSQLSGGVADLTAGPTLAVTVASGYVPNQGTTFSIIPGAVSGAFNLLPNGATFGAGGVAFRINYASATLTVIADPASIPTLSWLGAALLTILLLGLGMRMLSLRAAGTSGVRP